MNNPRRATTSRRDRYVEKDTLVFRCCFFYSSLKDFIRKSSKLAKSCTQGIPIKSPCRNLDTSVMLPSTERVVPKELSRRWERFAKNLRTKMREKQKPVTVTIVEQRGL